MNPRNVLVGITGGIAAYRTLDLIRLLSKEQCTVRGILTEHAAHFVTPLSVETLSGNPVALDPFARRSSPGIEHIELALWPALAIVAPATANFLGKLANGIADDLLSTTMLALRPDVPLVIAPAMNTRMWNHPATQRNLKTIASDYGPRLHLVGPVEKDLACGEHGMGGMADPADLLAAALMLLRTREGHKPPRSARPLPRVGHKPPRSALPPTSS
jgi:phosphopantothenoylcysteine decarboxylase/phosphopantothenate--cysteine ligase